MQGVRMDVDQLIDTYGVSRRLAVRIAALLARGIEVSPTLVEIAGAGSPFEKFLLHKDLFENADRLSKEQVARIAAETSADSEGPLTLAETGGAKVIALEEELLAEKPAEPASDVALVRHERAAEPVKFLDEKERRELFNREEIAHLKLEVLAGRDAEARISALRKLVFAPVGTQEKGGIFLRALMDRSAEVRGEAIKALESLGFERDTADAVRRILEGDEKARHGALRRLGDLLNRLQPGEQRVVLAVLVEVFRESSIKGEHDPLLQLLKELTPILPAHPEIVPEMARVAVQQMLSDPQRLGASMRDLLDGFAAAAPEAVTAKLWEECETVRDPKPRAILLGLLAEVEKSDAGRSRLCEAIALELVREDMDEMSRQKLGHNLAALGDDAAEALLRQYESGSNAKRAMLASFLDVLGVDKDVSDELRNRIAAQLTASLASADRPLRQEIFRSRLFGLPVIDDSIKRRLADELITLLKVDFGGPETADRAALLLEKLGPVAADGLLEYLKKRLPEQEADAVSRLLGRVLSAPEASGSPAIQQAAHYLLDRLTQREATGGYAIAVAQIVTAGHMEEESKEALDILMDRFARFGHTGDVIEAISLLASRDFADASQRVRAVHILGELLDRPAKADETTMREVSAGGTKQFEITGRVEFDSEILPAAVRGLCRIALAAATLEGPRERIVAQFIRIWRQVAAWEVVWGPRSSQTLAEALGDMAAHENTNDEARAEIIAALGIAVERISVVRALNRIYARATDDEKVNELIVDSATNVLDQWIQPEISPEELQEVLAAVTEAAARPTLNARRATTRKLRERVVGLVLDAMRAGHAWHRPLLEKLDNCPSMPRRQRTRVREALAKTAIVKVSL